MSYTALVVLAVALAVVADLVVLRTRLVLSAGFWRSYAVLFVFQLLCNGILTGIPVVSYDPATITGVRLVYAPVEDLVFGWSLILLVLASWVRADAPTRGSRRGDVSPGDAASVRAPGRRSPSPATSPGWRARRR